MFRSVLIANRGEIACRVIRTAKRLGLRTIAVYSQADAGALHVSLADEAHLLGPAAATQSYLKSEKILEVARSSGAECIHPGYGFLSENAEFAEACAAAGVAFVGPPPSAIRAMGLKDAAKALMEKAGVPVVPGYHGKGQDDDLLAAEAGKVGYPLLIKAVAGGGGKGMRRVDDGGDFAAALASCRREAKNAFGDDRVLIERFVTSPRHIEIQVFADAHGNCVHLSERDCSLQRRHQKVIEEAPAPGMTPEMRAAMGAAAVAAAKSVGYEGAGTVEFIADGSNGLDADAFFFMEMNTRLQVEHPVTEMVTGVDLVEFQLRAAAGEPLPFAQADLDKLNGHAVEARLYAEDPASGFLPQTGTLHELRFPRQGGSVRIDTGVAAGHEVSPFYDPMIAKVICAGPTREIALARLRQTLDETRVLGLRTNVGFLSRLVGHPDFISGKFDTGFIDARMDTLVDAETPTALLALGAYGWVEFLKRRGHEAGQRSTDERISPWDARDGWVLGGGRRDWLHLMVNGTDTRIVIHRGDAEDRVEVVTEEASASAAVTGVSVGNERVTGSVDGEDASAEYIFTESRLWLAAGGHQLEIRAQDLLARDADQEGGGGLVRAPMSGKIIKIDVAAGTIVRKGDRLAVLEAMKMEHTLVASADGTVSELGAGEGDQVDEGQMLIALEIAEAG